MSGLQTFVIVGNGIAGITAAEILRAEDPSCGITIIADDPFPAYYRPALKDFLGGRLPEEKLWARPAMFYQDQRIRFIPGRVVGINVMQHFVQLHNGKQVSYSRLLLANGALTRSLSCPGLNLAGVSTLRTVADYREILRQLRHVRRVIVSGSGTLALESAETLRHRGYEVTHLVRGSTLWSEVLDPVAAELVLQEERRDGIDVRTGEEIAEVVGKNGQVSGVLTTHGEHIACEMVLIAIGIEPIIDFIAASGIACGRGVKVDNGMRTNGLDIYAAGDVVETTEASSGRARVLGQWYPAIQQAQVAAYNMLDLLAADHPFYRGSNNERRTAYLNYYNATFLYGLDFVSIGLTTGPSSKRYQEIVADPQPRSYRKAILKNGTLVGVMLLGDRARALAFKRAIDHRVHLASVADRLFAESFDLDDWLDQQHIPAPVLNISQNDSSESDMPGGLGSTVPPTPGSEEYPDHSISCDFDAFLVPVPHPDVPLAVNETQVNRGGQGFILTIGRQRGVSLLLEHSTVSRLHAEMSCESGLYQLRDKGSSNGTFVNDALLPAGKAHTLRHHDRVRFGDAQFLFEFRYRLIQQAHDMSAPPDNFAHVRGSELHARISRVVPQSVLRTLGDAPALVLVGQNTSPIVVPLVYGRHYTLGREKQNDVILDDTSLSRHHAEIFTAPDGFYVRDLKSRNGVFVNRARINNAYHLSHGDRIVVGNTLLYFSFTGETREPEGVSSHLKETPPPLTSTLYQLGLDGGANPQSETLLAGVRSQAPATSPAPVLPVAGLEHRREVERLGSERVTFEIDMCIGCNRCMETCPLPVSSLVTIADGCPTAFCKRDRQGLLGPWEQLTERWP